MIDNDELAGQFLRAGKLFENYRASRCKMLDPHRGQGRVLAILAENPEISQKKLSFLLDMRNQSLSELLAKLEKAGLITRVPSEEEMLSRWTSSTISMELYFSRISAILFAAFSYDDEKSVSKTVVSCITLIPAASSRSAMTLPTATTVRVSSFEMPV